MVAISQPGRPNQPTSDAPIAASNSADVRPQDGDLVEPPRHSFPSSDTVLPLSTARRLRRAGWRVPLPSLPGKGTPLSIPRRSTMSSSIDSGRGEVSASIFVLLLLRPGSKNVSSAYCLRRAIGVVALPSLPGKGPPSNTPHCSTMLSSIDSGRWEVIALFPCAVFASPRLRKCFDCSDRWIAA